VPQPGTRTNIVRYRKKGIATFDASTDAIFRYMSAGNHPHKAFKSHRLVSVVGNVVTIEADIYNPDGSTFTTTIVHTLNPPHGVETTMRGGPFSGAKFVHAYTSVNGKTQVDLEGEFPAFPGMAEADELEMIDGFSLWRSRRTWPRCATCRKRTREQRWTATLELDSLAVHCVTSRGDTPAGQSGDGGHPCDGGPLRTGMSSRVAVGADGPRLDPRVHAERQSRFV
jgi:hypothetical protein